MGRTLVCLFAAIAIGLLIGSTLKRKLEEKQLGFQAYSGTSVMETSQ